MSTQESETDHGDLEWRVVAARAAFGLAALIGILSLFGVMGNLFVFDTSLGQWDFDVVRWISENRSATLDTVANNGSKLSDTLSVIGVSVGASTMLWASGHRRQATMVVLAIVLEFVTFLAVGAIVDRPRPDVETLNSVPSTPSYPSGHSAAAFVLYGTLVLAARSLTSRAPRWLWAIPVTAGLLVAASRVYEGVHHPLDVVAGLLLGVGALGAAALATDLAGPRLRSCFHRVPTMSGSSSESASADAFRPQA